MIRVIIAFVMFMFSFSTAWTQTKKLYFLNKPESISTPQRLAKFNVKTREQARIFFHYKNSGTKTMQFKFKSNKPVLGIVGFSFSTSPGIAGAQAVLAFFKNTNSLHDVNINHKWLANQTISGIVEFTAIQDTQIECQTGDAINSKTRIGIMDTMESILSSSIQNEPVKIRFPGKGPEINLGLYGVKQYIIVTNTSKVSKDIVVYASPRASKAIITWGVNGIYHNTPMIPAKNRYRMAVFRLKPAQSLCITTMPAGGMAYPVEIEFVPRVIGTVANANESRL